MSGHRETDLIRRRLQQFEGSEAYRHAEQRQGNALQALDALLAENERNKRVARNSAKANADLRAENQRLREALEQIAAIDLVKYVGAPLLEVQRIAREALAAR